MKELEFLDVINKKLSNNTLLGDDCAYLKDLGLFITQDTLVENVHFTTNTTSPYLLGRKAISVNLSDLAAAMAEPAYVTVSLSLPSYIENEFVSEFYRGVNEICEEKNIIVAGGDITGADSIIISVCAIGKKYSEFMSSRKFAKKGDFVVVTGFHGSSSAAFYALSQFLKIDEEILNAHLDPVACLKESKMIADIIDSDIVMMDTSDGLVDALFKISQASKHSIEIDINSVPVNEKVVEFSERNNLDYKNFVKWGGEDFELLICISPEIYSKADKNLFTCIGRVVNKDTNPCVIIKDGKKTEKITKEIFSLKSFNHFK